jgi:hypothetical protein
VAHYQHKYRSLPFENSAGMLRADDIDAETAELLSAGMRNLMGGYSGRCWRWAMMEKKVRFTKYWTHASNVGFPYEFGHKKMTLDYLRC